MITVTTTMGTDVTKKPDAAARRADRADAAGSRAAAELAASGALDGLFAKIDAGEIELTGDGGFIPGLIKATLERGLQAELTGHLGYEKGDPDAKHFPNSRNGSSAKSVATQVGDVDLAVPRDRGGSFTPRAYSPTPAYEQPSTTPAEDHSSTSRTRRRAASSSSR